MAIKKLDNLCDDVVLFHVVLFFLVLLHVFVAVIKFLHRLLTDKYLFNKPILYSLFLILV